MKSLIKTEETREQKAEQLYTTSKQADPVKHALLEREFNEANRQLHEMKGGKEPYVYQKDVREEFSFHSRQAKFSDGSQRRVETAEGPLYDPDTVINWRQTKVGKNADRSTCGWARKEHGAVGDGDDVGHRIMVSQGVDPAEKRNVGMQNRPQNQGGGTYYVSENHARELACKHRDEGCRIEVKEVYQTEKHGSDRSVSRDMKVTNARGERLNSDKVRFGNFYNHNHSRQPAKKATPPAPSKPRQKKTDTPRPAAGRSPPSPAPAKAKTPPPKKTPARKPPAPKRSPPKLK